MRRRHLVEVFVSESSLRRLPKENVSDRLEVSCAKAWNSLRRDMSSGDVMDRFPLQLVEDTRIWLHDFENKYGEEGVALAFCVRVRVFMREHNGRRPSSFSDGDLEESILAAGLKRYRNRLKKRRSVPACVQELRREMDELEFCSFVSDFETYLEGKLDVAVGAAKKKRHTDPLDEALTVKRNAYARSLVDWHWDILAGYTMANSYFRRVCIRAGLGAAAVVGDSGMAVEVAEGVEEVVASPDTQSDESADESVLPAQAESDSEDLHTIFVGIVNEVEGLAVELRRIAKFYVEHLRRNESVGVALFVKARSDSRVRREKPSKVSWAACRAYLRCHSVWNSDTATTYAKTFWDDNDELCRMTLGDVARGGLDVNRSVPDRHRLITFLLANFSDEDLSDHSPMDLRHFETQGVGAFWKRELGFLEEKGCTVHGVRLCCDRSATVRVGLQKDSSKPGRAVARALPVRKDNHVIENNIFCELSECWLRKGFTT